MYVNLSIIIITGILPTHQAANPQIFTVKALLCLGTTVVPKQTPH